MVASVSERMLSGVPTSLLTTKIAIPATRVDAGVEGCSHRPLQSRCQ